MNIYRKFFFYSSILFQKEKTIISEVRNGCILGLETHLQKKRKEDQVTWFNQEINVEGVARIL